MIFLEPTEETEELYLEYDIDFGELQQFINYYASIKYDVDIFPDYYISIDRDEVGTLYFDKFEFDLYIDQALTDRKNILYQFFHEIVHFFQYTFEKVSKYDITDYITKDCNDIDEKKEDNNKYEKQARSLQGKMYHSFKLFQEFKSSIKKLL